jgi:uncharacterized membrane protein HdeD (DUF308 family)
VSETDAGASPRVHDRYWLVLGARAIVALAVGLVVTFSSDHSAAVGHNAFGALALALGVVAVGGAVAVQIGIERVLFGVIGILGIAAGLVSLLSPASGAGFFFFLVSAWAVISGFLELYLGIRARRASPVARDWIFAGGLGVLLAIVVLLVPANFLQTFTGPDGVERTLTGTIVVVGVIGAYAAVLGVYLVIAALSLRWSRSTTPEVSR